LGGARHIKKRREQQEANRRSRRDDVETRIQQIRGSKCNELDMGEEVRMGRAGGRSKVFSKKRVLQPSPNRLIEGKGGGKGRKAAGTAGESLEVGTTSQCGRRLPRLTTGRRGRGGGRTRASTRHGGGRKKKARDYSDLNVLLRDECLSVLGGYSKRSTKQIKK